MGVWGRGRGRAVERVDSRVRLGRIV